MVRTCNLSFHPSSHVKMTAELVLNLVWLAVAIYAAVRLTMWCSRQPRGSRKVWTGIIATACLVALLFPIISVTDDLSNDATVIEETRAVRRAFVFVVHVVAIATIGVDIALLVRASLLQLARVTVAAAPAVVRPGFATVFSFRGPPAAAVR